MFKAIDHWIFDLDNTLYPAHSSVWAQIDANIKQFMMDFLQLEAQPAFALQKDYYRRYGTTLNGLMHEYGLDPEPYLAKAHAIDLSGLAPHPSLKTAIENLKGEKYIFTSGSCEHAGRVLKQLGLEGLFKGVFDIRDCAFTPKPKAESYAAFLQKFPINPLKAAFVEDLPRNLEVPKRLGMATLLVLPLQPVTREKFEGEGVDAPYIDAKTQDLAGFLIDNAR
jgi:putative hydrolase of the HAD superfamily